MRSQGVVTTYQSVPRDKESGDDKSVRHVSEFSTEEDDPLIEERTVQSDSSCM